MNKHPRVPFVTLRDLGMILHAYGESLDGPLAEKILNQATGRGMSHELVLHHLDVGIAKASTLVGLPEARLPDVDTHLGAFLEDEWPAAEVIERASSTKAASDSATGLWDFTTLPPSVTGLATRVSRISTPLERDEEDPDSGYARLGIGGRSQLEMDFEGLDLKRGMRVEILLKTAMRRWLPYYGSGFVLISCDGNEIARYRVIRSLARVTLYLPPQYTRPGEHRLVLSLDPMSSTTVRVSSAKIEAL
jgi:hypothetical protein